MKTRKRKSKTYKTSEKILGFIALPFISLYFLLAGIFWILRAICRFFFSIPEESNMVYGLFRFATALFLIMVTVPEQKGFPIYCGNKIENFLNSLIGQDWGGVIFGAISVLLFIGLLISFFVMLGIQSQYSASEAYAGNSVDSDTPRLNRMLKNLDSQFTNGARASDFFSYINKQMSKK